MCRPGLDFDLVEILSLAIVVDDAHLVQFAATTPLDELVGVASIAHPESDTPCLCDLFVQENCRKNGVGRQLVKAALKWVEKHEKALYLHVRPSNVIARALCEQLRFEYTGEKTDDGSVWMVKPAFEGRLVTPGQPPTEQEVQNG